MAGREARDADVSRDAAIRLLARTFPAARVSHVQRLHGGISNVCYRARVDPAIGLVVLRFYTRDARAQETESAALKACAAADISPAVVASGIDAASGAFAILRYMPGMPFRTVRRRDDPATTSELFAAVGAAHARIAARSWCARSIFAGRAAPEAGADDAVSFDGFLAACLAQPLVQRRLGAATARALERAVATRSRRLTAEAARTALVHGDFSRRNIIVRYVRGRWIVAGVVDWELACSGSPLADAGHILRYETGPGAPLHFARGVRSAGGRLKRGWLELARVIDACLLAGALTKPHLPAAAAAEIAEIIRVTPTRLGGKNQG